MPFEFKIASINDIILIKTKRSTDNRGLFIKGYEMVQFKKFIHKRFEEDYVSQSKKNVLRGLHYQIEPKAQGKLITVIAGRIIDVALDIRTGSETFGKYSMNELKAEEWDSIWIPPGFAHGFLSLDDNSTVLNRTTECFDPNLERGIRWNDPYFAIKWPLFNPILSPKDGLWKLWERTESNLSAV